MQLFSGSYRVKTKLFYNKPTPCIVQISSINHYTKGIMKCVLNLFIYLNIH